MDYRKNMNTPRDMIDPELLLRLMRENEPVTATFGGCVQRENHKKPKGNCGCGEHDRYKTGQNYTPRQEGSGSCPTETCANDNRMKNFPLAMAYVPMQEWEGIADDETALTRGTLFDALHLPWYASACDKKCGKCSDKR